MLEFLRRLYIYIILLLAQVLILNHIHLFGVATPLLYVYFAVTFHRNYPRWQVLLWCFMMGLSVDIFASTPGLAAGCLTLVGFVQTYLLEKLVPRDSAENLKASISALGFSRFATLSVSLVGIYCLLFFALEAFSFFDVVDWVIKAVSSAVLTLVLMLVIESLRAK